MRCSHERGFTLLELVVAIALLAVVSWLGYASLRYLQASAAAAETHLATLRQLQVAVAVFERDLRNAAPRSVAVGLAASSPALEGARREVALTRGGFARAPGESASGLMRIGYRFKDGELRRRVWPVLDQPAGETDSEERPLLAGLESVSFRYADGDGGWGTTWRGDANTPLPKAVELSLTSDRLGTIRRLVVLN